ncbi:MAG: hypothetical protein ACREN6_03875 [Gemmatimonadaceae bacterium]
MGESNPYLKQFFATRRRLKIGLTIASATGGAAISVIAAPPLILVLPPLAIIAATVRLAYSHRERIPTTNRLN